jgi:hypothetical protein
MTDTTITSTFYEKIASACRKKEALFDENLFLMKTLAVTLCVPCLLVLI